MCCILISLKPQSRTRKKWGKQNAQENLMLTPLFQPTITSSSTHSLPGLPPPHLLLKPPNLPPQPRYTPHTVPKPPYPPLPFTQSLQAAPGLCSHAWVARSRGSAPAIAIAVAGSKPATPQLPLCSMEGREAESTIYHHLCGQHHHGNAQAGKCHCCEY